MANKVDLCKLWPYSWQYCSIELKPDGSKYDIGVGEVMFVNALNQNNLDPACTVPNKEELYAAWNTMTAYERNAAANELYQMDNSLHVVKTKTGKAPKMFYFAMVAAYNKGDFDIAKCEALAEEYHQLLVARGERKPDADIPEDDE